MRELALLLAEMCREGIISNYALFGAIAQMRYTEPVATLDADVLIVLPSSNRLDVLSELYQFCSSRGFLAEGEAIRVAAWPVQFIPVFNALAAEAVEQADSADFEGVPLRVVRPAHLAVLALSTGRAKDFARILALLEAGSATSEEIGQLSGRHGFGDNWKIFTERFLDG